LIRKDVVAGSSGRVSAEWVKNAVRLIILSKG
jgi:hypothetical protein